MKYYEVVTCKTLKPNQELRLSYSSNVSLHVGQIVRVPFGKTLTLGVVINIIAKPKFKTKPIESISELPPLSKTFMEYLESVSLFFANPLNDFVNLCIPSNLFAGSKNVPTVPTLKTASLYPDLPKLTTDQSRVIRALTSNPENAIIRGITGSGKTRIYAEIASKVLKLGKDVVILVPEIGLISQMDKQLRELFKGEIYHYHSNITQAKRRNIWIQALNSSKPQIWIGTRSALFLPIKNIGLIIADESHDGSYYQDNTPRYSGINAAAILSNKHKASFILGSATPSVEQIYWADEKKKNVHVIENPVNFSSKAEISLIDLKKRQPFSWLSSDLKAAIELALERKEQSLLFINRRGNASMIQCTACGWIAECRHCGLPQTLHSDQHVRKCHICGRQEKMIAACLECREPQLLLKGCGTKELERIVRNLYPRAKILRADQDSNSDISFEDRYKSMISQEVDIIIGTQMITKGFDLPRLTTIGIIHADAGLSIPDYSAAEKTFQLIYQVIGRGGRHLPHNRVIIQAFRTDDPSIKFAAQRDWDGFYKYELKNRRESKFPPFSFVLKLTAIESTPEKAETNLNSIARFTPKNVTLLGPAPAFHSRKGNKHIWQLVALSKSRKQLISLVQKSAGKVYGELDPPNLL